MSLSMTPFQRLDVNEAPLSEVMTEGTPMRGTYPCKKAVAASDEDASLRGQTWRNLVVLQMAVSRYLFVAIAIRHWSHYVNHDMTKTLVRN